MSVLRFNADEVFDIAIQIERNGSAFYRRAAVIVRDAEGRELLLRLAGWEDEHGSTFQAMRAQLTGAELESTVFDPENEAVAYLRSLANSKIFDVRRDPAAKLTGAETYEDILREAIGREKDSVIFYLGMRELVPERFGRSTIYAIITEEMRHLRLLNDELSTKSPEGRGHAS